MTEPKQITKRDRLVDGNKFFNVKPTPADDRPPHGMPADMPTQGEYRDMAAGETLLARLAKLLGW